MKNVDFNSWRIEFNSGIPVYKQIVNLVSAAMAAGMLREGDKLPTIRELKEMLDVNPNTVAKAYRELELKGLLCGQRGNGSFVTSNEAPPRLTGKERKSKIRELYDRVLAEARGYGLTEEDLRTHFTERRH